MNNDDEDAEEGLEWRRLNLLLTTCKAFKLPVQSHRTSTKLTVIIIYSKHYSTFIAKQQISWFLREKHKH